MAIESLLLDVGNNLLKAYPNANEAVITITTVTYRYIFLDGKVIQIVSVDEDGNTVKVLYTI